MGGGIDAVVPGEESVKLAVYKAGMHDDWYHCKILSRRTVCSATAATASLLLWTNALR